MVGKLLSAEGMVFQNSEVSVAHKKLKEGAVIPRHNYPGCGIFFMTVSGSIQVQIDEEEYPVLPGKILNYNGEHYMSAKALEDAEFYIFVTNLHV